MVLEGLKENIVALVMIVILAAAGVIAVASFRDSIEETNPCDNTSAYWNHTSELCQMTNSSCGTYTTIPTLGCFIGAGTSGTNNQYNVTVSGLKGSSNAMDFTGTIGSLLGVGALISVVVSAFYFVAK